LHYGFSGHSALGISPITQTLSCVAIDPANDDVAIAGKLASGLAMTLRLAGNSGTAPWSAAGPQLKLLDMFAPNIFVVLFNFVKA